MNVTQLVTKPLPVGSVDHRASGWWGMWCLIATEGSLFAYLLFSYFYLGSQAHGQWVPELPKLALALPNTLILIASSIVLQWGETGIRHGRQDRLVWGLGGAIVLGIVFVGMQALEWHNKPFGLSTDAYASSYFVTTGFHMLHVIGGLLVLGVLLLWTTLGLFNATRYAAVSIGSLYWHFVDVVWLAVFTTYYLLPYLG
ncbi:cytochrome c oxidase subunit 3 [Massilia horti]|uniref:Heme-copper oxidase subunit III n=1 Tax=Massilia horti TaxID=2562153 RepID=A0A4Y9T1Q9_9BURK|nr:cytochrome c oxidase subunit 3 [Massilia horti]TFW32930.1 heme-copper oxidase subunit III [Massilia horti]